MEINRNNKDRLFRFIFGNPEHKDWTLSLYNAVNQSNYTDTAALEFNTIDNVLYMGMKNDVSFLIADTVNIYEQQATYNPNMPIRCLIYIGMIYSKYAQDKTNKINLYSSTQQKFPAPKLVCFYNGTKKTAEKTILHLSNAFEHGQQTDIHLTVTMLNINYGKNKALLSACRALDEYSWLIDRIRYHAVKPGDIEQAVDVSIDELTDDSVLKPFLLAHKAEVKRMCITEYNEEETMRLFREEYRLEGQREGRHAGKVEIVKNMILGGKIPLNDIAGYSGLPLEEVMHLAENL